MITVRMTFDDGTAKACSVSSFGDGVKAVRKWLEDYVDAPASDPLPVIEHVELRRTEIAVRA